MHRLLGIILMAVNPVVAAEAAAPSRGGNASSMTALDGFGNPVDWWFVLKLPSATFTSDQLEYFNTDGFSYDTLALDTAHCTCADPVCDGVSAAGSNTGAGRGVGLCYLYADSNNATLRYFEDVADPAGSGERLGCLGGGGADPLSRTLEQLYEVMIEW